MDTKHIDGYWKCYQHHFGTSVHDEYIHHVQVNRCDGVKLVVYVNEKGEYYMAGINDNSRGSRMPWQAKHQPQRNYNQKFNHRPI